MLAPLVYVDLVGKSESESEQLLLAALQERAKPTTRPAFPQSVSESERVTAAGVPFPGGVPSFPQPRVNPHMVNPSLTTPPKKLSSLKQLNLIQPLNQLAIAQFEELLGALNPPSGVVAGDSAPPRVSHLRITALGGRPWRMRPA